MPYTRKEIVTAASILYLIILTAVASYATSRTNYFSLPVSPTLTGFTSALPLVAGALVQASSFLNRNPPRRNRSASSPSSTPTSLYTIIANVLILVYSTVVITLLGTHSAPQSDLLCGLEDRWKSLFQSKDGEAIKAIQDTFNCCGFRTIMDRAYPFKDKKHGDDACVRKYDRTRSCFADWRGEEQKISGLLMGIVGLVVIWQLTIVIGPSRRPSWLANIFPRHEQSADDEEQGNGSGPPRAIEPARYSDRIIEEESDDENENRNTRPRVIEEQAQDNLPTERSNGSPAQVSHVGNEWADH